MNMHLPQGVYFTMPQGRRYLADTNWPACRDTCAAAVGKDGLLITLENTRWPGMQRLEEAAELLLQAPCMTPGMTVPLRAAFLPGDAAAQDHPEGTEPGKKRCTRPGRPVSCAP